MTSATFEPVMVIYHIWHSADAYDFLHIRGKGSQAMQAIVKQAWRVQDGGLGGGGKPNRGRHQKRDAMTHWPSCSHAGKSSTTSKYLHVLHTTITLSKSVACPLVAPRCYNPREKRPVSSVNVASPHTHQQPRFVTLVKSPAAPLSRKSCL